MSAAKKSSSRKVAKVAAKKARKPAVLPKSDGNAGVQQFIDSMEPWQAEIARRVDALVVKHVPHLNKAIRWHCPFYGVDGQGWFLALASAQFHVNITFFLGTSLMPVPPNGTDKHGRSLNVRERDEFDEQQFVDWIEQASAMPGWDGGSPSAGGVKL